MFTKKNVQVHRQHDKKKTKKHFSAFLLCTGCYKVVSAVKLSICAVGGEIPAGDFTLLFYILLIPWQ